MFSSFRACTQFPTSGNCLRQWAEDAHYPAKSNPGVWVQPFAGTPTAKIGLDATQPLTSAERLRELDRRDGNGMARGSPSGADAELRGTERGHAYLDWLHSGADQRPIAPLEAFR